MCSKRRVLFITSKMQPPLPLLLPLLMLLVRAAAAAAASRQQISLSPCIVYYSILYVAYVGIPLIYNYNVYLASFQRIHPDVQPTIIGAAARCRG